MPPRRSARVAAVVERESSALPPLPLSLALAVFALLPVDARLRCREVCRGWRAVLWERSLWTRLDLSKASGGLARPATDALLRAAAARAGGELQSIDVAECRGITQEALLAVVSANAGALRELRAWTANVVPPTGFADVAALLRAAPQLRVFDADVSCRSVVDAQRMLRNEGAFASLQLRKLEIHFDTATEAGVLSLAGDVTAHPSVVDLFLVNAPLNTPAALDAVVAAALANRFSELTLGASRLSPASAPALARLLNGGGLCSLSIINDEVPLLNAAAAEVLGDALRANHTLDELMLSKHHAVARCGRCSDAARRGDAALQPALPGPHEQPDRRRARCCRRCVRRAGYCRCARSSYIALEQMRLARGGAGPAGGRAASQHVPANASAR